MRTQHRQDRATRRRYSRREREQWVRRHAISGLSKAAFCRKHGLNQGTFHTWCRQAGSTEFAEVTLDLPSSPTPIEVIYPDGVRVLVSATSLSDAAVSLIHRLAGFSAGGSSSC